MMLSTHRGFLQFLLFLNVSIFSLMGCATDNATHTSVNTNYSYERENYSIRFNMGDTPDIELLDYWISTTNPTYVFKPRMHRRKVGDEIVAELIQARGEYGQYFKPLALYAKWRVKSTGKVYEDTADFHSKLPTHMKNSVLTFDMPDLYKGERLFVYLVLDEARPKGWSIIGPKLYVDDKVLLLYPTTPQ